MEMRGYSVLIAVKEYYNHKLIEVDEVCTEQIFVEISFGHQQKKLNW